MQTVDREPLLFFQTLVILIYIYVCKYVVSILTYLVYVVMLV